MLELGSLTSATLLVAYLIYTYLFSDSDDDDDWDDHWAI